MYDAMCDVIATCGWSDWLVWVNMSEGLGQPICRWRLGEINLCSSKYCCVLLRVIYSGCPTQPLLGGCGTGCVQEVSQSTEPKRQSLGRVGEESGGRKGVWKTIQSSNIHHTVECTSYCIAGMKYNVLVYLVLVFRRRSGFWVFVLGQGVGSGCYALQLPA